MNTDSMPKISFYRCTQIVFFSLTLIFLFSLTGWAQSYEVSLEKLIKTPEKYDKKKVLFKSEIIGDPLSTKEGSWFNVQSQNHNMSIFLKDHSSIDKITYWGNYKRKGDIVEIEGVFYKNGPVSNQRAVHLISLEVVRQGKELKRSVCVKKKKAALISLVIFLTIGVIYLIRIKLWHKK
ncbi:MAG: hypothetical protein K9L69_03010 [Candidatus Omnitrophica bacterium]|nr:hypothetical protein [Candidatus Omnitrophota bacterium]MCF7895088.1 hypothetical protein [Candidatus Omnitrophota bacterium]